MPATKEQLMQAYQIGSALANYLIKARPFRSWGEVVRLTGIGEARLASIQFVFTLSAEDRPDCSVHVQQDSPSERMPRGRVSYRRSDGIGVGCKCNYDDDVSEEET